MARFDRLRTWWVRKLNECKPNFKAVHERKHHYYTAAGISIMMLVFGWMEVHFHIPHWLYAINETFFTGHKPE